MGLFSFLFGDTRPMSSEQFDIDCPEEAFYGYSQYNSGFAWDDIIDPITADFRSREWYKNCNKQYVYRAAECMLYLTLFYCRETMDINTTEEFVQSAVDLWKDKTVKEVWEIFNKHIEGKEDSKLKKPRENIYIYFNEIEKYGVISKPVVEFLNELNKELLQKKEENEKNEEELEL